MSLAQSLLLWNLTKTKEEVSGRGEKKRITISLCEIGK